MENKQRGLKNGIHYDMVGDILGWLKAAGKPVTGTNKIAEGVENILPLKVQFEELFEQAEALNLVDDFYAHIKFFMENNPKGRPEKVGKEHLVDAIADTLVTTCNAVGYAHLTSNDINMAVKRVMDSNYSKYIPINHPDVDKIIKDSIDKYSNQGIEVTVIHTEEYYIIQNRHTGKILKSTLFFEPTHS